MAPNKTIIKRNIEKILAIGSKLLVKLLRNLLNIIPKITGTVTIKNICNAIFNIDIEALRSLLPNITIENETIIGIVITDKRLIIAVKETDNATSPFAKEDIMLEVAPPGAAAINITPIASSWERGQINTSNKATIGRMIICAIEPTIKSLGFFNTLAKSLPARLKPKENMIKANASGKNKSEIIPIIYNTIRF